MEIVFFSRNEDEKTNNYSCVGEQKFHSKLNLWTKTQMIFEAENRACFFLIQFNRNYSFLVSVGAKWQRRIENRHHISIHTYSRTSTDDAACGSTVCTNPGRAWVSSFQGARPKKSYDDEADRWWWHALRSLNAFQYKKKSIVGFFSIKELILMYNIHISEHSIRFSPVINNFNGTSRHTDRKKMHS